MTKELDQKLTIVSNVKIADLVYRMELEGDNSLIAAPGQFINIKLPGFFLRRPISICDWEKDRTTIIYKVVGQGTERMSAMVKGESLNCLMGLGNGFDIENVGDHVLCIGGGVGTPPMYGLAKKLLEAGKKVSVVLGFNSEKDVFYTDEFKALGEKYLQNGFILKTATVDGSYGTKGFVTDCFDFDEEVTDYCACGPMPMLRAVYGFFNKRIPGQLSFEERMGCGFGACVGCSLQTRSGIKKVCHDGPVFLSHDVIF